MNRATWVTPIGNPSLSVKQMQQQGNQVLRREGGVYIPEETMVVSRSARLFFMTKTGQRSIDQTPRLLCLLKEGDESKTLLDDIETVELKEPP
jgi:hypothetical protein